VRVPLFWCPALLQLSALRLTFLSMGPLRALVTGPEPAPMMRQIQK